MRDAVLVVEKVICPEGRGPQGPKKSSSREKSKTGLRLIQMSLAKEKLKEKGEGIKHSNTSRRSKLRRGLMKKTRRKTQREKKNYK